MRLIGKVVARLPISLPLGLDGQTESIRGLSLSKKGRISCWVPEGRRVRDLGPSKKEVVSPALMYLPPAVTQAPPQLTCTVGVSVSVCPHSVPPPLT